MNLNEKFDELKKLFKNDESSVEVTECFFDIYNYCIEALMNYKIKRLNSLVPNKSYLSFTDSNKISRAINQDLFAFDNKKINSFFRCLQEKKFISMNSDDITMVCYSIAISFCCIIDLTKTNDQKTPGTFFEYLIGHLYARKFGIKPRTQLDILNLDMKSKLPTDFIFDLGDNKPKYHIPVKTSTRERVIQVWAHQRVLDGVYGTGRFLGLLTCLSETKLDHNNFQVIEICLPDQWRLYQMFIAQLKRVYYLDMPEKYAALNHVFPKLHIKQFGDFFFEADELN